MLCAPWAFPAPPPMVPLQVSPHGHSVLFTLNSPLPPSRALSPQQISVFSCEDKCSVNRRLGTPGVWVCALFYLILWLLSIFPVMRIVFEGSCRTGHNCAAIVGNLFPGPALGRTCCPAVYVVGAHMAGWRLATFTMQNLMTDWL